MEARNIEVDINEIAKPRKVYPIIVDIIFIEIFFSIILSFY